MTVWSNRGNSVAFANKDRAELYSYTKPDWLDTRLDNIKLISYPPGIHRNKLKTLPKSPSDLSAEQGIYFEKYKTKWRKIGTIIYADVPDTGNVLLYVLMDDPSVSIMRSATNKPDTLRNYGYTKKQGVKGAGNLNWGVCNVQYVGVQ